MGAQGAVGGDGRCAGASGARNAFRIGIDPRSTIPGGCDTFNLIAITGYMHSNVIVEAA